MSPDEYQNLLLNTAPPSNHNMMVLERLYGDGNEKFIELLHAQLGMTTEVGEFTDALKRFLFYGRAIDRINVIEELGDLVWYIGLAIHAVDTTWGEVFTVNISKLKARYPKRFETDDALNRDLEKEREVLNKEVKS
ncbi:MAG TPA: nucleoside triphosphate pyrophosphohydrolase family protein [Bacteroidia bacterium]|jgi:NTP pyrophosphatase (non-canonical NTP hydrolase)|nr:nucleoside triphosphate pyrophosphohydrolase family protein [Bacteroidia bacterium]